MFISETAILNLTEVSRFVRYASTRMTELARAAWYLKKFADAGRTGKEYLGTMSGSAQFKSSKSSKFSLAWFDHR